jgi:hypothetical protein
VKLLGHRGAVKHRQLEDCLFVELPARQVCDYVPCVKITLAQVGNETPKAVFET